MAPATIAHIGDLRIRPAAREDMNRIADLVRSSAEWYRPIVDPDDMDEHEVPDEWAETNFRRREFYLGIADDEPVGTISLQTFGEWAYVGYVYLDVEHVGRGFGGKLLEFAAERASGRGLRGLSLIAHPEATWAKRAYLKFGFEIAESSKDDVLAWNDRCLQPYYEEGFELYLYPFE